MRSFRTRSQLVLALALLAFGCNRTPEPAADDPTRITATDAARTAVLAGNSAGEEAEATDDRPRVVFLGDSLTAGYGLQSSESVPSLIQARLDAEGYRYRVVNAGVSGDTTAGGRSRLDYSLAGDVEVLVLELGANDGLRGLPVAAMKENLDDIIGRAKSRGITVLLTGMEAPPNYGAAYTSEFRAAFRDLAEEYDLPFVPFFLDGVAGIPHLNLPDEMHPNPEGARIVEATVWRALEPLLDK